MWGRADRHEGPVIVWQANLASGAYGTVLSVPLEDLPDWLRAWCLDHLGGEPAGVLFQLQQVSMVFGLRLAAGRDVVVKPRADDGRAGVRRSDGRAGPGAAAGRRPAVRAGPRRLRGTEPPVARPGSVGGA